MTLLKYLTASIAITAGLGALSITMSEAQSSTAPVRVATATTPPLNDGLPMPGFSIEPGLTAVVITDPQNDFLSPKGVAWGVVGKSVTDNNTVENLETLFKTANAVNMPVFVSPHYYYKHDHKWKFEGTLEKLMQYINNGKTVVTSPHKVYGPETNDLVLQLRKAGISKVILAGMSANLCTESHMRELGEQGFDVHVVTDATAAAITPNYDGYAAALTNYRFIASNIDNTANTARAIKAAYK